jgi:membrane AbrB-like protein
MVAVGIAALAGRPVTMPPVLTQTVLVLLGITLGSLVSRQLIQHMSAYPLTIGLLALATFCSTFGSSFYLQRFHGWDQTSALLAGSPGALSQITMLAAERGADVAAIAVVQTMRVIILTAALPLLLALTGIASDGAGGGDRPDRLAARTRRAGGGGRRHSPAAAAGQFSGELDVRRDDCLQRAARHRPDRGRPAALDARRGAGRHRRGDRHAVCADQQEDAAQPHQCRAGLVRGRHRHLRRLRHGDRAGHQRALRRRRRGVRAGAMDAMLALALTLHIDPIFVGAHHLSRFVFVSITTPGIVHLFGRPQEDVDD